MRNQPLFLDGIPVLVVEDEGLQALDLAASLREAGALPVGPAATCTEALRLLNAAEIRAVVLDLRLQGEDGTWLAWELYRRRLPFLVHTGYLETRFLPNHWGGCQIMFKPASMDRLVRRVGQLVRWSRMVSRNTHSERARAAVPAVPLLIARSARAV